MTDKFLPPLPSAIFPDGSCKFYFTAVNTEKVNSSKKFVNLYDFLKLSEIKFPFQSFLMGF